MRSSPYTIKTLCLLISCILITACDSKSSSSSSDEIDTINIFFDEQASTIFSYNPETGETRSRVQYNAGDNQIVAMDTNDDKQGYEYAAYVKTVFDSETLEDKDKIFLFDYVTGLPRELATFDSDICGIHLDREGASDSIDDSDGGNKFLYVDQPNLLVSVADGSAPCSPDTNNYFEISFWVDNGDENEEEEDDEAERDRLLVSYSQVSSGRVLGDHILDFRGDTQEDSILVEIDKIAPAAFVGYDIQSQELEIYVKDRQLQVYLPYSQAIPFVQQVTEDEILITRDNDVFIHDINHLLSFVANETSDSVEVPSGTIEDVFAIPEATLNNLTFNVKFGLSSFILEDGDELKILKKGTGFQYELIEFFSKSPDLVEIDYFITNQGLIFLHKKFADREILSKVVESETQEGVYVESTVFIAEQIQVFVYQNKVYVNTLDSTDIAGDLTVFDGWQSHYLETRLSSIVETLTYNIAQFVVTPNINTSTPEVYLLGGSTQGDSNYLTDASLYIYDPEQADGRQEQSLDDSTVDVSFGTFLRQEDGIQVTVSVSSVVGSSIINDIYGYVDIEDSNQNTLRYYFNPSEKDEPSLAPVN